MSLSALIRMSGLAVLLASLAALAAPPVASPKAPKPTAAVTPPPPPPGSSNPAAPDGQWVYTEQYGWLWLPYDAQYTWAPAAEAPLMYAYGAELGWTWLSAPWLDGVGPRPYFDTAGDAHFAWAEHPLRAPPGVRLSAAPRVFVAGRPFIDERLPMQAFLDFDRRFGAAHEEGHADARGHRG